MNMRFWPGAYLVEREELVAHCGGDSDRDNSD
jgi:hypothetical protein